MDGRDVKLSILIVDDDQGILETMADIFVEKDFSVTVASDGFKAIDLVKDKHFDAIILDVRMPGIDGVETFKKMKKIKRVPKTIFMTAYALEDMIQEAKAEGAIAVFMKPIDIEALDTLLKEKMDSGSFRGAGTPC